MAAEAVVDVEVVDVEEDSGDASFFCRLVRKGTDMDLLQAIDDMPGPAFLVLYGVVILATLAVCRFWACRDATRNLLTPPVPKDFDPVEIAYLRAGENAATHLTVFDLLQRGYLEMIETRKWLSTRRHLQQSGEHPVLNKLTPMERAVFAHFTSPLLAADVFASLPGIVAGHCGEYQQRCEDNNLLTTSGSRTAALTAGLTGTLIILGLGGFKLWDALEEQRTNIGFLSIMAFIAMILLAVVCWRNRQTHLGKRYLAQLQRAFETRSDNRAKIGRATGMVSYADYPSGSAMFVALGVLGTSALDGTEYAYFHDMFSKVGGGVSGGGCGGGGGGGGGCGGGCGGG